MFLFTLNINSFYLLLRVSFTLRSVVVFIVFTFYCHFYVGLSRRFLAVWKLLFIYLLGNILNEVSAFPVQIKVTNMM